jgi:hypothetical protein
MRQLCNRALPSIMICLSHFYFFASPCIAAVTPIESSLRIQNVASPPSANDGIGSVSGSQGPTIQQLFRNVSTNRSSHVGSVSVYTSLSMKWDHPELGEQNPAFGRTTSYVYQKFDADISSNYYAWGAWSYYTWNYTFNLDTPDTFVFTPHGELTINGRLDPLDDSINFSLDDAAYQNLAGTQYIPLLEGEHTVSFSKSIFTRETPVVTRFTGYVDWYFSSVPEPSSLLFLSAATLAVMQRRRSHLDLQSG